MTDFFTRRQGVIAGRKVDFNFNFNCFPLGLSPIKETPAGPDITRPLCGQAKDSPAIRICCVSNNIQTQH